MRGGERLLVCRARAFVVLPTLVRQCNQSKAGDEQQS